MADVAAKPGHEKSGGPLVVVAVDGSEASQDALRWAADYTGMVHGRLRVATAWQWPVSMLVDVPIPEDFDPGAQTLKRIDAIIGAVLGDPPAVPVTTRVRCGSAAAVVLEAAAGADLLVLGSHGHGGFAGLLLGSVSENCARHAECPVTIVRHQHRPGG